MSYRNAMLLAYTAAARSPDPSNQNGGCLVGPHGDVYHVDCNRFPVGFEPQTEHLERPRKYGFIVHAEQSTILQAAAIVPVAGSTLICPWAACTMCARTIVESKVARLVVHGPRMNTTPERWMQEVEDGMEILRQGGVAVERMQDALNLDFSIKVNGEDWTT